MKIKDLIPIGLKNYKNLIKNKMKYKDCDISTPYIENGAILRRCKIGRNVDIRKRVEIGEYSYVNENSIIISGKIGRYCSIRL